jgi:hypothetical protein
MKTQIQLSEAVGKTLTGYSLDGFQHTLLLMFDEEFVCLTVENGYHDEHATIEHGDLNIADIGASEIVRLGIMSQEEINAMIEARQRAWSDRQRERDRQIYEQLKAKFEPTNQPAP